MKTTWKVIMIFTTVLLVLASAVYAAVNTPVINNGEVTPKSWFGADQTISNQGTINGDMFSTGQSI